MLRIGQVEATATQDGKYTDGSVAGGIAATRLRAAAFNAMQEELAHIVESAGLALDINDMTQVLKAIQKLTLSRANPFADIKSDGAAAISTALTNLGSSDGTLNGRLLNVHLFTAGGQYTPTVGMKFILAHMIGGGGASGGTPATSSSQTGGVAAGNSGAYAYIKAYASDIGAGKAVSVGAGGKSQVNGAGFAGGTTAIADIADVTGGYGSGPGSVSATTAVAQPSYDKPVINKYNKTEVLVSA